MNHGPLIFLGIFLALAASWYGTVVAPLLQFGHQQQVTVGAGSTRYPAARSGQAQRGKDVYRANGCFYCHTSQVRQSGVKFDVVLVSAGTNKADLISAALLIKPGITADEARKLIEQAPKPLLQGVTRPKADAAAKALAIPDVKFEIILVPVGGDVERGWGSRVSVAQDYLYEQPLMLGNQRIGPDLTTIGARQRSAASHLLHLYNPQATVKGSTMPPYRFLFEKRKAGPRPSPDALQLPAEYAVEKGFEIVPTEKAHALVAYLLSLDTQMALFEAPMPTAPKQPELGASTNQTSATASTNTAVANQPAPK